jgi:hypothetical protein
MSAPWTRNPDHRWPCSDAAGKVDAASLAATDRGQRLPASQTKNNACSANLVGPASLAAAIRFNSRRSRGLNLKGAGMKKFIPQTRQMSPLHCTRFVRSVFVQHFKKEEIISTGLLAISKHASVAKIVFNLRKVLALYNIFQAGTQRAQSRPVFRRSRQARAGLYPIP